MYFYQLIETEINEEFEDGMISSFMEIYHEEEFSSEQFGIMCDQAIRNLKKRGEPFIYNNKLAEELRDTFEFKIIKPTAHFEYEF